MKTKVRHLFGPLPEIRELRSAIMPCRNKLSINPKGTITCTGEHLAEIPKNKFKQTLVPSRLLRASFHILAAYSG
jgi:hypothetical protein